MNPEHQNPEAAAWQAPEAAATQPEKKIDETERRRRDLRHTIAATGWFKYWKGRLKDETDLPDGVRQIVSKEQPADQAERNAWEISFQRYVKARLANMSVEVPKGRPEEEAVQVLEEISEPVSAEMTSEPEPGEGEADQSDKPRTKSQLRAEHIARARRDYGHPTTKKDWLDYWMKRFQTMQDLPKDLADSLADSTIPDNLETIKNYADRQIHRESFGLAKQDEMDRLHVQLRRIDDREEMEPREMTKRRNVSYDKASGGLVTRNRRGETVPVTEGDVVADMMWGVKYRPDSSVPEDEWRRLRRLIAIREAGTAIQDLNNRQLADEESIELPTSAMSPEFIEQHPTSGMVAERMAQSMILRLQHDYPKFGFKLEQSNALEDMYLKYDFKIVFTDRRRGVALAGTEDGRGDFVEEKKRLGLQFTINDSEDAHRRKTKQIDKANRNKDNDEYKHFVDHVVSEIVLVVVPMLSVFQAYRTWIQEGKPTGGPEQFLDPAERRAVLEGITDKIPGFDRSQLDKMTAALER